MQHRDHEVVKVGLKLPQRTFLQNTSQSDVHATLGQKTRPRSRSLKENPDTTRPGCLLGDRARGNKKRLLAQRVEFGLGGIGFGVGSLQSLSPALGGRT